MSDPAVTRDATHPYLDPEYSEMGRERLIAYCERLRELIKRAAPLTWAATIDTDGAHSWERDAVQALYGHGTSGAVKP